MPGHFRAVVNYSAYRLVRDQQCIQGWARVPTVYLEQQFPTFQPKPDRSAACSRIDAHGNRQAEDLSRRAAFVGARAAGHFTLNKENR
jgi:hypothetical protein